MLEFVLGAIFLIVYLYALFRDTDNVYKNAPLAYIEGKTFHLRDISSLAGGYIYGSVRSPISLYRYKDSFVAWVNISNSIYSSYGRNSSPIKIHEGTKKQFNDELNIYIPFSEDAPIKKSGPPYWDEVCASKWFIVQNGDELTFVEKYYLDEVPGKVILYSVLNEHYSENQLLGLGVLRKESPHFLIRPIGIQTK